MSPPCQENFPTSYGAIYRSKSGLPDASASAPRLNCYMPARVDIPPDTWIADCWVCDQFGRIDPGLSASPVPVILARSMTASERGGAESLKVSTRIAASRELWLHLLGIGSFPIMPPITGCRCGLSSLNSIELASGGACWLGCELYERLGLGEFWAQRLPDSREGIGWRDPPFPEGDKRQFGYSRDKRPDCVQVALIVTPEGFPLAYEVLAGNTSDKTTLKDFLKKIEDQYGKVSASG